MKQPPKMNRKGCPSSRKSNYESLNSATFDNFQDQKLRQKTAYKNMP